MSAFHVCLRPIADIHELGTYGPVVQRNFSMIVVLGIATLCLCQSDVLAAKASDVPYPIYESVGPDKRPPAFHPSWTLATP